MSDDPDFLSRLNLAADARTTWKPLRDYEFGEHMTVEDFRSSVEMGLFIDYDGSGYPAIGDWVATSIDVLPSTAELIPEWATHVVWFNR